MLLETKRLIIRSIQPTDENIFIEMASDGSLWEIFGDCSECHKWMGGFISDAIPIRNIWHLSLRIRAVIRLWGL